MDIRFHFQERIFPEVPLLHTGKEGKSSNAFSRKRRRYQIWVLFVPGSGFSNSCELLIHLPAQHSLMQVQVTNCVITEILNV